MELVVPDEKLSASPSAARARTCASPPSSPGWKLDIISESQVQADGGGGRRRSSSRSTASPRRIARRMYRLGFRTLEELAEASEQELAAIPGLGGAEAAARIQDAAPRRRWSACARSASARPSSRTEPLTERERLLFIRGVGERTVAAPRGRGLQDRRGHPPRGRGQAGHQDGPRHQEGARHQAGRRALPVERGEGDRGGAPRSRGQGARGGPGAGRREDVEEEYEERR